MGADDEIMKTERRHDFLLRPCIGNRGAITSARAVLANVGNNSRIVDLFMVPDCNGGIK
jgi:hypothetical protein